MFKSKIMKNSSLHISTYKYGDRVTNKFLNELIDILRNCKFDSYLLQCLKYEKGKFFTFLLFDCPMLNKRKETDFDTFDKYLDEEENVIFENINKDCLLISPNYKVLSEKYDYSNISRYFRTQTKKNLIKLLRFIFDNYQENMYLNTHGLGVNYLHFRLDNKPKYYI